MPPKSANPHGPSDFLMNRYNKLDKAAFDALDHVDFKKSFTKADSFGEGVVDILKGAGVDQKYLKGISGDKVGSDDWFDAFRGVAEAGTDYTIDTMLGTAVQAIFPQAPGAGGAFVAVWEKIREWWRRSSAKGDLQRIGLLGQGTWVYINNGASPEEVEAVGWFGSTEYEVGHREGLRRRMLLHDEISTGFFIGLGSKNGRVQVFNFQGMRPNEVRFEDVSQVPDDDSKRFDANTVLTEIRDLYFQPDEPGSIDTNVNTDPGSEAIYNGFLVHVVKTERDQALIEHSTGERLVVTLDKLKPGRRTHSNTWNYSEGYKDNGFLADGSARIFAGQWVWIDGNEKLNQIYGSTVELACVWKIGPDGLHVFRTLSGAQSIVQEFAPLADELNDFLSTDYNFSTFKDQAVVGGDTERFRMSQHPEDVLICVGKTHDTQIKLESVDRKSVADVTPGYTEVAPPTYDEATRDGSDNAREIADLTGVVQRKGGARQSPESLLKNDEGSSIMPFVIGGAVILLAFNYIDFKSIS